jgi:hypothetical protein
VELFKKINDVYLGRYFLRSWWWSKKVERLARQSKLLLRKANGLFGIAILERMRGYENAK